MARPMLICELVTDQAAQDARNRRTFSVSLICFVQEQKDSVDDDDLLDCKILDRGHCFDDL